MIHFLDKNGVKVDIYAEDITWERLSELKHELSEGKPLTIFVQKIFSPNSKLEVI